MIHFPYQNEKIKGILFALAIAVIIQMIAKLLLIIK
jgi:hypothetical protein